MSAAPDISVIMSVYNGEAYLEEAVNSVLNQTFQNWELIVINDCSTDCTAQILQRYAESDSRVKVYTNEVNLRLPSSLNKALALAKGKYIARMDADDICLPQRLEKQFAFMEANPQVDLSSCRFMTLKNGKISSGGCGGKTDSESIKALLLVTNPVLHPGIIAKSSVIRTLGYDKTFTCTEDMELWTRFVMGGYSIRILSEYLMVYRLHDKQITGTTLDRQRKEVVEIQKRYFGKFLQPMDEAREAFYIKGIYFREETDILKFIDFYKWLRAENRRTGAFEKNSLSYAMLEILAEYKRKGISKGALLKALLVFDPVFLMRELRERKRRASNDGRTCIAYAQSIGLVQSGGTLECPEFSRKI